ncbi:MAG: lysophospholipase [Actinobacteria bacterium]|nr:lysophospholipase [Actinomycetota bacterium]MBU1866440.1 lysophospholipase [Actinomycetota bacterium]
MQAHERTFAGSEGTIFYRVWEPAAPRRIVVLVHGYAEHSNRYAHVAAALVADGAAVYAEDHLGHGRSDGERALIVDFEHVVDDLAGLVARAGEDHPGLPIVMLGHSMGGLLSARFAQRHPGRLAGLVLCGAVVGDWNWARDVLQQAEMPPAPDEWSGMSRDPQAVHEYSTDPLVYRDAYKRPLLEAEVIALDRFMEQIDRVDIPVLFLHGAADPYVPYATSLAAVKAFPTYDLTVRVYPGARHEVLNEINKEEVIAEVADFCLRVAP